MQTIVQIIPAPPGWIELFPAKYGYFEQEICALALVEDDDEGVTVRFIVAISGGDWLDYAHNSLAVIPRKDLLDSEHQKHWIDAGQKAWASSSWNKVEE